MGFALGFVPLCFLMVHTTACAALEERLSRGSRHVLWIRIIVLGVAWPMGGH